MLTPKWDSSGRWTGGFTSSVDYWDRKSRHLEDAIHAMHERESYVNMETPEWHYLIDTKVLTEKQVEVVRDMIKDEILRAFGTECKHHLNICDCAECSLEKAIGERDQARGVCRHLRSELRKARRELREIVMLGKIVELEKDEVMRRMKPQLDKFWAETWDRVWNGDPEARQAFPGLNIDDSG